MWMILPDNPTGEAAAWAAAAWEDARPASGARRSVEAYRPAWLSRSGAAKLLLSEKAEESLVDPCSKVVCLRVPSVCGFLAWLVIGRAAARRAVCDGSAIREKKSAGCGRRLKNVDLNGLLCRGRVQAVRYAGITSHRG